MENGPLSNHLVPMHLVSPIGHCVTVDAAAAINLEKVAEKIMFTSGGQPNGSSSASPG